MSKYIISVDQSTQGTKALVFDESGTPVVRCYLPHKQWISEKGYVSHDAEEIYENVLAVIREAVRDAKKEYGAEAADFAGLAITNQRETTVMWSRRTGEPLAKAIVWQCSRASAICERAGIRAAAASVLEKTGIPLSPYFPAAKMRWLLENTEADPEDICLGTIDAYLIYRLTGGKVFATDVSNASRTELLNIHTLAWDQELCNVFGVSRSYLPEVLDSDGDFGETDFGGLFETPVRICGVMGDSHAALFGQNCRKPGLAKSTYGTGSSIMMNIGDVPVRSGSGLVTSVAWGRSGHVEYVLEGNLNYTGAVITWLRDDMKMIASPGETEALAEAASHDDRLYLVPAFTGLGAPYWKTGARAAISGMDRTTGRNEVVRAGLECIAYQITDVVRAMEKDTGEPLERIAADGGPTRNRYLMQFQSDILRCEVNVSSVEELSATGAAFLCGMTLGLYDERVFDTLTRKSFRPEMERKLAEKKYEGWKEAVERL